VIAITDGWELPCQPDTRCASG